MPSQSSGDGAEKRIVDFGPDHRIVIENDSYMPEHRDESGKWIAGTGIGGWCVANYGTIADQLASESADRMITCELFEVQTLDELIGWDCKSDSICHPPFARSEKEIEDRYKDLRYKGVYRINYIWHNYHDDWREQEKAESLFNISKAAAEKAGLKFTELKYEKEPLKPGTSKSDQAKDLANFFNGGTTDADERRGFKYTTLASADEAEGVADELLQRSNTACPVEAFFDEFNAIDQERQTPLPKGNAYPDPSGDWAGGFTPSEPEKKNNPACAKQRARALTAKISHLVRSNDSGPTDWYIHDGTQWKLHDGNDAFNSLYQQEIDALEWVQQDNATVNTDRAAIRRRLSSVLPPAKPGLLPFINCCLDVNTRQTVPHSPQNGNRYRLEYHYKPTGKPPARILAFLRAALQDEDSVNRFIAFLHEILIGNSLKLFLEITGPSDGGKSVITNLAIAVIGILNTASCELEKIENTNNRFETFFLRGKRLAIFPESQKYKGLGETLKKLTGQDRIRAEKKGSSIKYDFTFAGGIIVTGNAPVQFTDTSGAIINRRRSLRVDTPVREEAKRILCEDDGNGVWRGDLVDELPDFINYILDMPDQTAKQYLARNVVSRSVIESEKAVLLDTDSFVRWAEAELSFDQVQGQYLQMGKSDKDVGLYQRYLDHLEKNETGSDADPISKRNFKRKAVELFRDTLGLPLPAGNYQQGRYRVDKVGSVIPFLRLRNQPGGDALPGIITQAFNKRLEPLLPRNTNAENPVGNETNDKNDKSKVQSTKNKSSKFHVKKGDECDDEISDLNGCIRGKHLRRVKKKLIV